MKVFLSYPRSHGPIAEDLAARLRADGHDVFIDVESLPPGESYDSALKRRIADSDLFVSLIAGDSLRNGTYSRTEIKFAQETWPNPSGYVLPVALDEDAMNHLPAYLKSVTVMRADGDDGGRSPSTSGRAASRTLSVGRVHGTSQATFGSLTCSNSQARRQNVDFPLNSWR